MIPKYRAWSKSMERFERIQQLVWHRDELTRVITSFKCVIHTNLPGDVILMQSTGLKDKNGVEIFEGDVVRLLDSLYTVFYDSEKGSYRLKPHDDRWVVDYMSNFSHGGNFEVVGNIYENEEYL